MFWIETDLEPDDVLALYILPKANYYVVGEGNAQIKVNRMNRYLSILDHQATIIRGEKSNKKFPNDGKEFDDLQTFKTDANYMDSLVQFSHSDNPVMFMLKPPRELLNAYMKDPNHAISLVSNVTLYAYGSFNFRSLNSEGPLLRLLKSFKSTTIYESYFVSGDSNSANRNTFPLLYRHIQERKDDVKYATLLKLTKLWNSHIKKYPELAKKIEGHEDFQYVIADFGLAAIYDTISATPVSDMEFRNGYTCFDREAASPRNKIRAYFNIDSSAIENLIIEKLSR